MRLSALAALTALVAGIVVLSPAFAQDAERYAPKRPPQKRTPAKLPVPAKPPAAADEQVVPQLKGLIFVSTPNEIQPKAPDRSGIVLGARLPLLDKPEFRAKMQRYLGKPLTMRDLNQITSDVVVHYRNAGSPVVDTIIPEQDVTGGVVQVLVQEGRVGKVKVEDNKHFTSERLRGYVRTQPGDMIKTNSVLSDLDWINRNPFRRVDLAFERGANQGETDLVLLTKDRFPLRVYSGYENTGTESTGEDRIFTGFNWGDAFGLDHQLNYQFTTSPDYDEFNTHWASYVIPLPWRHELTLMGAYTQTQPDVDTGFELDGESWQTSARYEIPLRRIGAFEHGVTLGFDFKRSNNNLEFGGTSVFGTNTEIAQYSIGYGGTLADRYGQTRGNVTVYYSPGGLTSDNSDEAFEVARDGADAAYSYAQLNLQRDTELPLGFTWIARGTGQIADGPLLASEQIGFGGATSIRGYDERQVNGDEGFIITNELYTPSVSPLGMLGVHKVKDSLRLLAFIDYGVAYDSSSTAISDSTELSSAGPGVRYNIFPYLSIQYDYGFQLNDPPGDDSNGRHHLSALLSFSY